MLSYGNGDMSSRNASLCSRYRALVEQHYTEHLAIESYATRLNVSHAQLSKMIRRDNGLSARDTLRMRLIREAKRLLAGSDIPVGDVAAQLGYEDPSYFSRFFKKHTSSTPTRFRAVFRSDARVQHARSASPGRG